MSDTPYRLIYSQTELLQLFQEYLVKIQLTNHILQIISNRCSLNIQKN